MEKLRLADGLTHVATIAGITYQTGYSRWLVRRLNVVVNLNLISPCPHGLGQD